MPTLRYFAYGSNLHPVRLVQRVPSSRAVGTAVLEGWSLRFHKRGQDGSAKCDIVRDRLSRDQVHGVVYQMDAREQDRLDAAEGAGYESLRLRLDGHGAVFLYVALQTHIDAALKPFSWYKSLVLHGARHHALPGHYVRRIERVEATLDPDPERHAQHQAILHAGSRPE